MNRIHRPLCKIADQCMHDKDYHVVCVLFEVTHNQYPKVNNTCIGQAMSICANESSGPLYLLHNGAKTCSASTHQSSTCTLNRSCHFLHYLCSLLVHCAMAISVTTLTKTFSFNLKCVVPDNTMQLIYIYMYIYNKI